MLRHVTPFELLLSGNTDGLQDNVEFLANAPYPEIVRRLGEASIGLNTMQDEHFGINIVEFMVRLHRSCTWLTVRRQG